MLVVVAVVGLAAAGAASADEGGINASEPTPTPEPGTITDRANATSAGIQGPDAATGTGLGGIQAGQTRLDPESGGGTIGGETPGLEAGMGGTSPTIDGPDLSARLAAHVEAGLAQPADSARTAAELTSQVGSGLSAGSPAARGAVAAGSVPWTDRPGAGSSPDVPAGIGSIGTGLVLLVAGARQVGISVGSGLAASPPAPRAILDRMVRLVAPLRYSRYDDSDPLQQETRRQVFETIQTAPGLYLSAVAERAEIPLSTARHHARVLEQEGLVTSRKVRGKRRFFPDDEEGVALAAAVDDEPTASVLDALLALGESSVAALADHLDRDPSTVTHHLQRLEAEGLVVRERQGRSVCNRLAPAVRRALDPDAGGTRAEVALPADD